LHFALLGLLAGCGGSTDSPGKGGAPIDAAGADGSAMATTACAALAKARCDKRDACTNGVGTRIDFTDATECEARIELGCKASLEAPKTSATPAKVESCASAVTAETCSDFLAGTTPAECQAAPGAIAEGGGCYYGGQCATQYCAVPKGAPCGKCAPLPKAGDSCATTESCGPDLTCDRSTFVCVVSAQANAACNANTPCARGLSCVGATRRKDGVCQPEGTSVGAACDRTNTIAPSCSAAFGLVCGADGKCAAATIAPPGASCGTLDSGTVICGGDGSCERPMGSKMGTCAAPLADGAACDTSQRPPCLTPAVCVVDGTGTTGTCRLPDASACR
jgi:hypothetical protein